jgi:hypothetical protein
LETEEEPPEHLAQISSEIFEEQFHSSYLVNLLSRLKTFGRQEGLFSGFLPAPIG